MEIRALHVKNFRSIKEATLTFGELTALVGPNGSGKSSFLRALELFYDGDANVTIDDYFNRDSNSPIEIAITFANLSADATDLFARYIDNGALTVVRVFRLVPGKAMRSYHGLSLQIRGFQAIREAATAGAKKDLYEKLRAKPEYTELPKWTKQDDAAESLTSYEKAHPTECDRIQDNGQFFGFEQVATGYLGTFTRFVPVPAVRDASSDTTDAKGSTITTLMDLVVRSALAAKQEIIDLKTETQQKYDEILEPIRLGDLKAVENGITETLNTYVPSSKVFIDWIPPKGIDIPPPKANIQVYEDGFTTTVSRTGHGLQRALILTLLQHLAQAQHSSARVEPQMVQGETSAASPVVPGKSKLPNLVVGIEEPELYQHPIRQRHFANVLMKLSNGTIPGVAAKTQVLYVTHSPLMVGVDRFEGIRRIRKTPYEEQKPKVSEVISADLDAVAKELETAKAQSSGEYSAATLRPRLQPIMTPWVNEGFFADVVVLVEGESDRAMLAGVARAMGRDFESMGICVIPCGSKSNIDRPLVIFRKFGIRPYVVWDADWSATPKPSDAATNRFLLRLLNAPENDWPIKAFEIEDSFTWFRENMNKALRAELGGDKFDAAIADIKDEFGYAHRDDAIKNPIVVETAIRRLGEDGIEPKSFFDIVMRILKLAQP